MVDNNALRVYSITMSNLAFDTHKFMKDLTRNGMPDKQAEVLADHYASLLTDRLATKEDLFGLRKEHKGDIGALDQRITHEISGLRKELKGDIEALRKDMMITILSAQLVGIVTICTLIGFMRKF